MVGWRGVEPPIPHGRWILSPLHIPVLPPPHKGGVLGTGRHPWTTYRTLVSRRISKYTECTLVVGLTLYPRLDLRTSKTGRVPDISCLGCLRLASVGSELGERNNSQSLPTLYIYYTINLKKNQIIEFGVFSKENCSLTHFIHILYTKIAKKSKFKSS